MEFFIDVDGVILDFETSFMNLLREDYVPDLPQGYYPESWEMSEISGVDIAEAWDRFVNSERMGNLDLLCERESFNQIAAQYPLHLVSNIPNQYFEKREENLNKHGLSYSALHLAGHEKFGAIDYPTKAQKIAKIRSQDKRLIFLDDNPSNCKEIREYFPESEVFLMHRPHNKKTADCSSWTRVKDWREFISQVTFS